MRTERRTVLSDCRNQNRARPAPRSTRDRQRTGQDRPHRQRAARLDRRAPHPLRTPRLRLPSRPAPPPRPVLALDPQSRQQDRRQVPQQRPSPRLSAVDRERPPHPRARLPPRGDRDRAPRRRTAPQLTPTSCGTKTPKLWSAPREAENRLQTDKRELLTTVPPYEDGPRPGRSAGDASSGHLQAVRREIIRRAGSPIRGGFRADQPRTRHAPGGTPATQPRGSACGYRSSDPLFTTDRTGHQARAALDPRRVVATHWHPAQSRCSASGNAGPPSGVTAGQVRTHRSSAPSVEPGQRRAWGTARIRGPPG